MELRRRGSSLNGGERLLDPVEVSGAWRHQPAVARLQDYFLVLKLKAGLALDDLTMGFVLAGVQLGLLVRGLGLPQAH